MGHSSHLWWVSCFSSLLLLSTSPSSLFKNTPLYSASKFSSVKLIWKSNVSLLFSHRTSSMAWRLKTLNQAFATARQSEITGQGCRSSPCFSMSLPNATKHTLIRGPPPLFSFGRTMLFLPGLCLSLPDVILKRSMWLPGIAYLL